MSPNSRNANATKLDRELLRKLELYGRFLESSRDYIIGAALDLVFRKDKAFAVWLETLATRTIQLPPYIDL